MKTRFNMFHLPALPAMEDKTESPEADTAPSWFKNFVNIFIKGHQPDTPQAQNKTLNHSTTQMKKDYQKVNSILKIEGVEVDKDGKVTLTENQVKALNDRIANLEQESSDKDTQISELKKQNENLQKSDGEDTTHINGDEGDDDDLTKLSKAQEMFNDVKDIL